MGNCASNPKTNEGEAPVPEPAVTEEVQVEQQGNKVEEETPKASQDKSLGNLLNENVEKEAVAEQVKANKEEEKKPETEEVKAEAKVEEKPKTEEAKPETNEEKPVAKAEN